MGLHLIVADVTWTPASFAELKTLVAQLSFATRHLLRFDFAQKWKLLSKEGDREEMELLIARV